MLLPETYEQEWVTNERYQSIIEDVDSALLMSLTSDRTMWPKFSISPAREVVPDAKIVEISCTAYIRELGTD